jgi:hypothetical protein
VARGYKGAAVRASASGLACGRSVISGFRAGGHAACIHGQQGKRAAAVSDAVAGRSGSAWARLYRGRVGEMACVPRPDSNRATERAAVAVRTARRWSRGVGGDSVRGRSTGPSPDAGLGPRGMEQAG